MTTTETVADVLAEMRALETPNYPARRIMNGLSDRIEAAMSQGEPVAYMDRYGAVIPAHTRPMLSVFAGYDTALVPLVRSATRPAQPLAVPVESLGRDEDDTDPSVFEQWYMENAPDIATNPPGTRQCWLMRKAWNAACYAHAGKTTAPPAPVVPDMIPLSERMPPDGELVLVYTPDSGDGERYDFDHCEEGHWVSHGEHYDHFLSVGKGDIDCPIIGPSEQAPYTHWSSLPTPTTPSPTTKKDDNHDD